MPSSPQPRLLFHCSPFPSHQTRNPATACEKYKGGFTCAGRSGAINTPMAQHQGTQTWENSKKEEKGRRGQLSMNCGQRAKQSAHVCVCVCACVRVCVCVGGKGAIPPLQLHLQGCRTRHSAGQSWHGVAAKQEQKHRRMSTRSPMYQPPRCHLPPLCFTYLLKAVKHKFLCRRHRHLQRSGREKAACECPNHHQTDRQAGK